MKNEKQQDRLNGGRKKPTSENREIMLKKNWDVKPCLWPDFVPLPPLLLLIGQKATSFEIINNGRYNRLGNVGICAGEAKVGWHSFDDSAGECHVLSVFLFFFFWNAPNGWFACSKDSSSFKETRRKKKVKQKWREQSHPIQPLDAVYGIPWSRYRPITS